MRSFVALLALAVAVAVLGGCGSSGDETTGSGATAPAGAPAETCALNAGGVEGLRVTKVSCGEGQRVAVAWRAADQCAKQGSRSGCSVGSYRSAATATGRGWSVSCTKPGKSVAFTVRRG
ncbi:MAG TPA: hypothetical protein VFS26_09835 [Solirubrobacterales bacterium]|nr:hypothetical protein [Solirubrobacterales bacterium]